jgi:transposase InsO family protein
MRIRDHPAAPRAPWQNGLVERLIGSIRRESLDHLIVFDEAQLRRVLKNYASYYNRVARISHWKRMRRILDARRSSARSQASQFSVGCIISTSEFRF